MNNPVKRINVNKIVQNSKNRFKDDVQLNLNLMSIDSAIMYYIKQVIKPTVKTARGNISVPVIYGNGQRWYQVRQKNYIVDDNGKTMSPVIVLRRSSVAKNPNGLYRKVDANYPAYKTIIGKRYSPNRPFSRFDKLNGINQKVDYYQIIPPTYITLSYEVMVWSDYVQQMNSICELLLYNDNSYWGNQKLIFLTKIGGDLSNTTQVDTQADRLVKTDLQITVNGYLIPSINQIAPVTKLNSASNVTITFQ